MRSEMLQTALGVTMLVLSIPHIPAVSRFLVERTVADNKSLAILSLLHLKIRWRYVVLSSLPYYYSPNIYH